MPTLAELGYAPPTERSLADMPTNMAVPSYLSVNPADTLGSIGAPAARALAHALGEPFRKGAGMLATMRDYSANEFPATQGATDVSTDYDPRREAAGYAAGTAMNLAGMGAGGAQPASAGIFGGRLAKTADTAALARAEEMAAKGANREQIWNDTGWFQGADQKWRFEIPDDKAYASIAGRRNLAEDRAGGPIAGYLWHSPLYEAYPNLRNTTVDTQVPGGFGGVSRGGSIGVSQQYGRGREEPARSIMLHEAQHEVQRPEGFMVGNAPKPVSDIKGLETDYNYFNDAHTILTEARRIAGVQKIEDLATLPRDKFSEVFSQAGEEFRSAMGRPAETGGALHQVRFGSDRADSIKWVLESYEALTNKIAAHPHEKKKAFDDYWRQASEVEARNVQRRMTMTPEERRAAAPWTTEDVKPADQIVK